MARSRRRARSVASVIANPRRRGKVRVKRNARKSTKSRRKAPRIFRANARRRSPSKKKFSRVRKSRRSRAHLRRSRKNGRFIKARSRSRKSFRRNGGWKRLSSRSASGWARKNGRKSYRKKSYRRNGRGASGKVAGLFGKIPLIGGLLGSAVMAIPTGLIAGATVEIPLRAAPMVAEQSWIPDFFKTNELAYFTTMGALTGAGLAALAKMAKINLPFINPAQLAALATAAGAGAGWAKMRTRQMANEAGILTPEQQVAGDAPVAGLGALVTYSGGGMGLLTADMGMGPAYDVAPGGYSYGAIIAGS